MNGFTPMQLREMLHAAVLARGPESPEVDPIADDVCEVAPQVADLVERLLRHHASKKKTQRQRRDAGKLYETLVAYAFAGLQGLAEIRSFPSVSAQYDLIARGSAGDADWLVVLGYLGLRKERQEIVVEVKATETRVNDQQMLRLCSLLDAHFRDTCALGVFVTLCGASGEPAPGAPVRSLRDARLHQVLFHARTQVPIVVLDASDLPQFLKRGGLLRVLARRLRDLRELPVSVPVAPPAIGGVPEHMSGADAWMRARMAADRDGS